MLCTLSKGYSAVSMHREQYSSLRVSGYRRDASCIDSEVDVPGGGGVYRYAYGPSVLARMMLLPLLLSNRRGCLCPCDEMGPCTEAEV